MQTSFKCPMCNRSAVNMELQWRKLDNAIEVQPMPSQFKDTKVYISCNDCMARSTTNFHWLGNKCVMCDSYNTNQIKMINSPSEQELQALQESREIQALREAERDLHSRDILDHIPHVPIAQQQVDATTSSHEVPNHNAGHVINASARDVERQSPHSEHEAPPLHDSTMNGHSSGMFMPRSPSHRGSSTDEPNDVDLTDHSSSGSDDDRDDRETLPDDVAFCEL